jgi:hypothetical protein
MPSGGVWGEERRGWKRERERGEAANRKNK